MPDKERYWKNPEHHRQEANKRRNKLQKLGFHGGYRNLDTYLQALLASSIWNKNNKDAGRRSSRKYNAKLKASVGGHSDRQKWIYKVKRAKT